MSNDSNKDNNRDHHDDDRKDRDRGDEGSRSGGRSERDKNRYPRVVNTVALRHLRDENISYGYRGINIFIFLYFEYRYPHYLITYSILV